MKKYKWLTLGGIQHKVFNLVFFTIILLMAAYTAVIAHQTASLKNIVNETNADQKKSITSISESTMDNVLNSNLVQSTQMEAYIAEDIFEDAISVVNIISDYATNLFKNPDAYPEHDINLPDKDLDGQVSVQLLKEESVDLNNPDIKKKVGLIANLSELMCAVYSDASVDSCYCATPDGIAVLVDNHSATKFDSNGNLVNISINDRVWFQKAKELGGLYFTDVVSDLFTGEISITCSLPIYNEAKEFVAVVGADLFLNKVSSAINDTEHDGSFVCIVNQYGHVLFSPKKEGIFSVAKVDDAIDLTKSSNKQLANFVTDSLNDSTNLRTIEIDDEIYYVCGAPIANVGWAILSVVPKSLADQAGLIMIEQFDSIQSSAITRFNKGMTNALITITVLIAIVLVLGISTALILSKRIVGPLTNITNRIQSLGGEDLAFKMEDSYKTKDEIQVLAEAFANLSEKTLLYINEVKRVTSEKERIGAELTLATRIQADMLPSIYPAFPERKEFDIFASMDPAKEVGGDFYNFFLIDDDHLCIFIADVSGKGVPAALFMMASMIILSNNARMGKTPGEVLTDTNAAICSNNREEMFVTVWLGILEISTGKLTCANAGHEFPVVKTPEGEFEYYEDKHDFVIGGFKDIKYKEYSMDLKPGSKLFLYTDGIPEAKNANKEQFGSERLLKALNKDSSLAPKEMLKQVRTEVDLFVEEAEQFDDLTMVCLEYKGK